MPNQNLPMFTGIIEEQGKLAYFKPANKSGTGIARMGIACQKVLSGLNLGASLATNGACLTLVEQSKNEAVVELSPETLNLTHFANLPLGSILNLERPLAVGDRLGGHWVQGHVDGKLGWLSIKKMGECYNLRFALPQKWTGTVVHKGSISIDGISLTVNKVENTEFEVLILPYTWQNTNLSSWDRSHTPHFEIDILAKYTQSLLQKT